MPKISNISFRNLPQEKTRADYEEAVAIATEDLKQYKSVHSAYLMGDTWTPGISDIDVIVVYNSEYLSQLPPKPASLSEKNHYLFTHDYNRYSKDLFSHLRYVVPSYYDLKLLCGERLPLVDPLKEINEQEYTLIKAAYVIRVLLSKLLLIPLKFETTIDVRRSLLWLHSINYTGRLIQEITGREIGFGFSQGVKNLRLDWFSMGRATRLAMVHEYIQTAPMVIEELVIALDHYLQSVAQDMSFASTPKFSSPVFFVKGIKNWNMKRFLQLSRQKERRIPLFNKKFKRYRLAIPESFFLLFSMYQDEQGAYSQWMNRFLDLRGARFNFSSRGITQKAQYLNKFLVGEDQRLRTSTVIQFGFHTTNLKREVFKTKLFSALQL